jgi:uncharacterized membrane protein YgcG
LSSKVNMDSLTHQCIMTVDFSSFMLSVWHWLLLKVITLHVFAGNELIEEDIDIGGNDLPPLTYPPVVFESEAADRSSKHSSSSTSSSESGSSSSGSDSSSSSGSDLGVKVPLPNSGVKENTQCVVSLDQENGKMLSQDKTLIF